MLQIEKILHSKKIRYDRLLPMVDQYIPIKKFDTVNIFIDLWDVVKQIYSPKTLEVLGTFKSHEKFIISTEIINMVAHYRHFFASRKKVYTNFILYYSNEKDPDMISENPSYREDFYEKRLDLNNPVFGKMSSIINNNFKLIENFLQYVPNVHVINSRTVDHSLVPYLFLSDDSPLKQDAIDINNFSIIVSNEKIHYQDLLIRDNMLQLELRGSEKSKFVMSDDIIDNLLEKTKSVSSDFTLLPDLYSLLIGLTGYKNFSTNGIKKMGNVKALKFLQKALDEQLISNMKYKTSKVSEYTDLGKKLNDEEMIQLEKNLNILNHDNYNFKKNEIIKIKDQIVERVDVKSVRYVVDQYFTRYPILLQELFEGEKYE
ncbi:hypothetical protein Bp8pS_275 [Bacillus phage vB_BpuM-BpSp]|nr:hypothetical protein Bp8pS_275 [Bacillus phage vB_BpuM-BpSp]